MLPISNNDIVLIMIIAFFFIGTITFLIGLFILVSRTQGNDVKLLAAQTAKLAHKGITEDVSGLVGNATALLEALNELVRTSTGIGIFLVMLGICINVGACWMVLNIK